MEERGILFNNRPTAVLDGGTSAEKLLKARQAEKEGVGGTDDTKPRVVDQVNANLQQRAAEREANMNKPVTTQKEFQPPEWAQKRADKYKPNPDAPKNPVAQWGEQKQAEFKKNHPGFSPGKAFVGAIEKGVQGTAQAFIDTLAFAEDLLWSPVEFLNDFEPGTISDDAIFNQWAEKIRENGEKIDAKHAENIEAGGNTGKFIYNVGSTTVQAIPQTVMALLTSGASAAAQTTVGLQSAANTALSPGVVSTVKNIVGNMAHDPQCWLAFSQNVGGSYQNAVEMLEEESLNNEISGRGEAMSSGEIQTKAALYALGIGLISAAIERSGGIQTLPDELRHGGDYWKMIVDSAVAEGKEEVVQGILDRANQNLILGQRMPLASLTDRNAVLSLPAAADEFSTGAIVGGIMSGGQVAAHGIETQVQSHAKLVADGYAKLRSGEMPTAAQLYAMGLNEPEARGMMVLYQMEKTDGAGGYQANGAGNSPIDFSNLEGSTADEVLKRIPDYATSRKLYPVEGGATEGIEYKWVQDGQTYRVRIHNADPGAPRGSNAANGWIVRIQRGRQYYD